ncbi:MAG TPA: DUF2764 family protein [Phycisphaerae bacterium]|nr:DUF2764 family protein [Phycisphaerae bacterium]
MVGRAYEMIGSLPSLPDLGGVPPITPAELAERVESRAAARRIVEAILLSDDLEQRDALLAGEITEASPSVLSEAQVRNEAPLPPHLAPPPDALAPQETPDAVWLAYWRHAAEVARRRGSRFLALWVRYEVSLRSALAAARARALDLDPAEQPTVPELADEGSDFTSVVAEWSAAANVLEGQKVLDRARWAWLDEHDRWFTFEDDELAAYAARLLLVHRWNRITSERNVPNPKGAGGAGPPGPPTDRPGAERPAQPERMRT